MAVEDVPPEGGVTADAVRSVQDDLNRALDGSADTDYEGQVVAYRRALRRLQDMLDELR